MARFLYFYLRSMRLYYCFVTGAATLAGVVTAHAYSSSIAWGLRDAAVLAIGFLAWGVNQIFSDWYDRREDAVNAPHRPMVTGELASRPALCLSGALMAAFAVTAWLISPLSFKALIVGGILNILYSLLKKIPVINTLVYGAAMTCCSIFGLGVSPDIEKKSLAFLLILLLTFPSHVLMCHNSYFKDIEGDRAARLKTLPVLFPRFSLWLGMILTAGWTLYITHNGLLCSSLSVRLEGFLWLVYLFPVLWLTARLLYCLWEKKYHKATGLNCQLCVMWLWFVPMIFSLYWLTCALVSFLLIHLLYKWYPDEKE